jgi:hypothetical protein
VEETNGSTENKQDTDKATLNSVELLSCGSCEKQGEGGRGRGGRGGLVLYSPATAGEFIFYFFLFFIFLENGVTSEHFGRESF